jgi:hypothetical protein
VTPGPTPTSAPEPTPQSGARNARRLSGKSARRRGWGLRGAGHPVLRRICDHVNAHATTVFPGHVDRQVLERTGPGAWTDAVLRCARPQARVAVRAQHLNERRRVTYDSTADNAYSFQQQPHTSSFVERRIGAFGARSWGRENGFTHRDYAARATGGTSKDTWDVRLMPMVVFSAQPSIYSIDGVSEKAPEVVVVHHFKVRAMLHVPHLTPHLTRSGINNVGGH